LLVLTEVYRPQQWLFDNNKQSIEDRIVSLSQPHIRPIVRGKAGKSVEFGAKLSASCFEGYVFLDRMSWDNFNESGDLKAQVEAYRRFTGYYPESVHADRIYRTRENRAWCKEKGIRISGPPLGRPPANDRIIHQRRFQRSTIAPAIGEIRILGSRENSKISENWVTEPVRWYTHTPRAKLVRPDPMKDTSCPNQTIRKTRI